MGSWNPVNKKNNNNKSTPVIMVNIVFTVYPVRWVFVFTPKGLSVVIRGKRINSRGNQGHRAKCLIEAAAPPPKGV